MKRPSLLVIGFSGNAIDAFSTLAESYQIVGFLDDNLALHGQVFEGIPVLPTSALSRFVSAKVICMIGSETSFRRRGEIIARLGLPVSRFATIVHSSANVSRLAAVGPGSIIFPGAQIISNAVVGRHVMVLPQSVLHHDVSINDYTLVGSRVVVAGHVTIGESCYIGSGATLKNNVRIGDGALVGMAANVLSNVERGSVIVGNPGRMLKHSDRNEEGADAGRP